MTRLLLVALTGLLLVPNALAQKRTTGTLQPVRTVQMERQIGVQTGSVTTRNISGQPSDGAVTLLPGNNAVFFGAEIAERSDAPCHLKAYFWRKPTPQADFEFVIEEYSYCGSRGPTNSSMKYVGIGDSHAVQTSYWSQDGISPYLGGTLHAARGLQVCDNDRNQNNIRMKGLRFFGATIDRDGNRSVNSDAALTNTEERNHCREWRTAQTCPNNQVMVGLDIHYRADGSGDPYSITALAPKCAPLTINAAQVPVSN